MLAGQVGVRAASAIAQWFAFKTRPESRSAIMGIATHPKSVHAKIKLLLVG